MNIRRIETALLSIILATSMILGGIGSWSVEAASSDVILGHAASGENGLRNQKPGDQTGKEVYTMNWDYNASPTSARNWDVVIRCNDSSKAKIMAKIMKDACDNPNVGYCITHRTSFFDKLKAAGWDASKIDTTCETSCTPMISACIIAAGIDGFGKKGDLSAVALYERAQKSPDFTCFTTSDYTTVPDKLMTGDIILSVEPKQHGAMVVSAPKRTQSEENAVFCKVKFRNIDHLNASISVPKGTELTIKLNNGEGNKTLTVNGTVNIDSKFKPKKNGYYMPGWTVSGRTLTAKFNRIVETQVSESISKTLKKGSEYTLLDDMSIRIGPGTYYPKKLRMSLTADGKKHALNGTYACIKKGTVVTCMEVKGAWVRTPSGWMCAGEGDTSYVKLKKTAKPSTKPSTGSSSTVTVGKNYKLLDNMNVRKGPGTNYAIKKRSTLSASARKHALTGTTNAVLKKGTVVTCKKVSKDGNWMQIPSGWICCKKGNVKKV